MNLIFAFNLDEQDFSGLPTYSQSYVEYFPEDFVINIIPNNNKEKEMEWDKRFTNRINCYFPRFQDSYYVELEHLILEVVKNEDIKNIIIPDYMIQPYLENSNFLSLKVSKNIKVMLFVHLLYRGMMNVFAKQPYYEQLKISAPYLMEKSWVEWKAVNSSDLIICNSEFTKKEFTHYYPECKKEVISIPLGIKKEEFPFSYCDNGRVAYFGRLTAQKGIFWIMRDIVEHMDLYKENPLIVAGEGDLDPVMMKAHFYDKTVDYRGLLNKDELKKLLSEVQYCIFPSIYEPYGLALNEALSMGKICIVNNVESGMLEQSEYIIPFDFTKSFVEYFSKFKNGFPVEYLKDFAIKASKSCPDEKTHFKKLKEILG